MFKQQADRGSVCRRRECLFETMIWSSIPKTSKETHTYRTGSITASLNRQSRITSLPQRRGDRSLVRQTRTS